MQFRNLPEDEQIEIHIDTCDSDGAPVAPSSAFTASDFAIFKNGSATAKATTNGITVISPFNSKVGTHVLIADTSNDTGDAGFWEIGARYQVKFNTAKTVDGKSIDGRCVPRGAFGIQSEYMRGTNAAALASGVTVTAIGANVITAASIATDAGTEIGTAVLTALGTGTWATAITDKTGNLPSDPADQSAVEAAITAAVTSIKGADNDTLKTLSDQIDGLSAATGSGARTVTITVNDGTTALQNARVRLTEGVNTYAGLTNASGIVVFNVDDATYTVGITKSGYTYAGTTLIVDGTETRTYSMTVVSVTPPDDPALCAVTMHIYDQYGADIASQPVEITFVQWETTATETPPVLSVPPVLETDVNGIVSVELFREATYKIVYGKTPFTRRVDVTIPDAATYTVEL